MTTKKESRGFEFPTGTMKRLEEARRRHGDRSVNARVEAVVLAWLDADEAKAAKVPRERSFYEEIPTSAKRGQR